MTGDGWYAPRSTGRAKVSAAVLALLCVLVWRSAARGAIADDIVEYGQACEMELGKPFPAVSCVTDGTEIPITIGSVTKGFADLPMPAADRKALKCDRPVLLGLGNPAPHGQCVPNSRIIKRIDGDVVTQIFCRRYLFRDPTVPADNKLFDDVNAIRYNTTTRKTCWFNSKLSAPRDAATVPRPYFAGMTAADKTAAMDFWSSPSAAEVIRCQSCHDNDLWIHSPWVDQVAAPDPNAVPREPLHKERTNVGAPFFQPDRTGWRPKRRMHFHEQATKDKFPRTPAEVGKPLAAPGRCTGCHNIAAKVDWFCVADSTKRCSPATAATDCAGLAPATCQALADRFCVKDRTKRCHPSTQATDCAGLAPATCQGDAGTCDNFGPQSIFKKVNPKLQVAGSPIGLTHWMPTSFPAAITDDAKFKAYHRLTIEAFEECCRNPDLTHSLPQPAPLPPKQVQVCFGSPEPGETELISTHFQVFIRGEGTVTMTPALDSVFDDNNPGFGGTTWTCPLLGDPHLTSDGQGRTQDATFDGGGGVLQVTCNEFNQFLEMNTQAISGFVPRYRIEATGSSFTGFGGACSGRAPCERAIWDSTLVNAYFEPYIANDFAGEESGFLPLDGATGRCERRLARAAGGFARRIHRCQRARALGELGGESAEEECESRARLYFVTLAAAQRGCPACIDLDAIAATIESIMDEMRGLAYCEPGTPFSAEDQGFMPPTSSIATCEARLAGSAGKLLRKILTCHRHRARGKLRTHEATQLCEAKARREFDRLTESLPGCTFCAGDNAPGLAALVESRLDSSNAVFFCASPHDGP